MYTTEEKRRAVELYIQYDYSCTAVVNELGYPCRGSPYKWYREYSESDFVCSRQDHSFMNGTQILQFWHCIFTYSTRYVAYTFS